MRHTLGETLKMKACCCCSDSHQMKCYQNKLSPVSASIKTKSVPFLSLLVGNTLQQQQWKKTTSQAKRTFSLSNKISNSNSV